MQFTEGSFPKLNQFVEMLRAMQLREDFDVLVGVSGFKGFGKSSFSIQVARRYVEKYFNEKFDLAKYTAYTIEDVFRLADKLERYSPLCCDEAVNFAMGEDWNKAENKRLKKVFTKIRTKHLIFFFNIPDLWWLDKKYRENMMTLWIHIVKKDVLRGHARVMLALPNLAPAIEDRWHRDWLLKAFKKVHWHFFSDIEKMMKILRKYPCYYDEFTFPKLPERIYQKHLELREKRMLDEAYEPISRRDLILYSPVFHLHNDLHSVMKKILKKIDVQASVKKAVLDVLKKKKKNLSYRDIIDTIYRNPISDEHEFIISRDLARRWNDRFVEAIQRRSHKS